MVDHDQQRVEAGGNREIGDQITGNLLEGAGGMGLDGHKQENSQVCV